MGDYLHSEIESKDTPTLKKLRICQSVNKFQSCQHSRSRAGPIAHYEESKAWIALRRLLVIATLSSAKD